MKWKWKEYCDDKLEFKGEYLNGKKRKSKWILF